MLVAARSEESWSYAWRMSPGERPSPGRHGGRARDEDIDARVLTAAARQLASQGYDAMSISAVADEARTTRQALYRRWPTKAALAAAALDAIDDGPAKHGRGHPDPLAALTAELADFQRGVSRPGRLSLVGTMLQSSTDGVVRDRYRAHVVVPRRERIRSILVTARDDGWLDADADIEVAVTMCTGSWYGRALAQDEPPPDWPWRTAVLVWRALGGSLAEE